MFPKSGPNMSMSIFKENLFVRFDKRNSIVH